MAFPVRLEVATLVGEQTAQDNPRVKALPKPPSTVQGLTPVDNGQNAPVKRPVFVIGDAVKRPKSAGTDIIHKRGWYTW